jgi:cell cycle checkpoint protein
MTGPSGSGKTATIRALANDLDVSVNEWLNPIISHTSSSQSSEREYTSVIKRFADFMSAGDKYTPLDLSSVLLGGPSMPSAKPSGTSNRSLLLIEDLPSLTCEPIRQAFMRILERFLSRPIRHPAVLIISDSAVRYQVDEPMSGGGRSGGSSFLDRMSRSILAPSVLTHPRCREIR